jgi:type I restriction enzyme S subunit
MFPNEGEDEPKIRFKAYKAQWNNLELVSILDVNSGRDYKHLANGQIPVYGTGGYMLSVSEALSNKDAIGIGRKGTIDNPFILKAPFWTVDTLFYVIPKKNQNLYFLYALFQNTNWKKLDESTGVPSLSKKAIELKRENVPLPDEQEKIGLFFMKIDNLLEKEQTLFETYNQLKKSYLQKIFAD